MHATVKVYDAHGTIRASAPDVTVLPTAMKFRFRNGGAAYDLGRVVIQNHLGICPFPLPDARHVPTGGIVEAVLGAGPQDHL